MKGIIIIFLGKLKGIIEYKFDYINDKRAVTIFLYKLIEKEATNHASFVCEIAHSRSIIGRPFNNLICIQGEHIKPNCKDR